MYMQIHALPANWPVSQSVLQSLVHNLHPFKRLSGATVRVQQCGSLCSWLARWKTLSCHVTETRCCQVYRGVLRSTGEEVAVKVQRPGIGERIALDMVLLRRFIGQVDRFLPSLLPDGFQVRASG